MKYFENISTSKNKLNTFTSVKFIAGDIQVAPQDTSNLCTSDHQKLKEQNDKTQFVFAFLWYSGTPPVLLNQVSLNYQCEGQM